MRTRTALTLAVPFALMSSLGLAGCGGDDASADAPPYTVVSDETRGVTRNLVVEVDSIDDLRGVVDALVTTFDEDAGYFVSVNCAAGGAAGADNRLANARYARGSAGQAGTGLGDGELDYSEVAGASCPAT
ncbi:hypothetical protein [Geodermatophilus sp. SYSU D00710]